MANSTSLFFAADHRSVSAKERADTIATLARRVRNFIEPSKWRGLPMPDGLVVVLPEGFGKSFLAVHLLVHGFKVVICCKSNAQLTAKADEIAEQWPANPEVQRLLEAKKLRLPQAVRYVSREQQFYEALARLDVSPADFRLIRYPSASPYASPNVDDASTVQALGDVFRRKGITLDAEAFIDAHHRSSLAPTVDARDKDIVLITLAAFQGLCTAEHQVWWRQMGLVASRSAKVTEQNCSRLRLRFDDPELEVGDSVQVEVPTPVAVLIDDPDRDDVDWLRPVSDDTAAQLAAVRKPVSARRRRQEAFDFWRGWGTEAAVARAAEVKKDNEHPDGCSVHRLVQFKGSMYVERPPEQALGHGFKAQGARPKLIVTSTEYITGYYALRTLQRAGLTVHNWLDLFHTDRCNVTAIRTVITRKKNHALLLPIVELLRREFPKDDVTLIANGLGCEFNLSNNKGRNDLAERTTIIKLSWSHPAVIATVGAHFPEATDHDLLQACLLGDVGNQALGRNQGFRFRGKQSFLLIDPRWYPPLIGNELIRYELNPWSSALPAYNQRLSKKAASLAFKVSSAQTLLEQRLLQLLADATAFGLSTQAAELMASRPLSEQKHFHQWLEAQIPSAAKQAEDRDRQARRKRQLAEAQKRFREKKRAKKAP